MVTYHQLHNTRLVNSYILWLIALSDWDRSVCQFIIYTAENFNLLYENVGNSDLLTQYPTSKIHTHACTHTGQIKHHKKNKNYWETYLITKHFKIGYVNSIFINRIVLNGPYSFQEVFPRYSVLIANLIYFP